MFICIYSWLHSLLRISGYLLIVNYQPSELFAMHLKKRRLCKKLFLGVISGLFGLPSYAQPVVQINDRTYHTGETVIVRASGVVSTSNSVQVDSGANIMFQAGDSIILRPGFRVQQGGIFNAKLTANKAQFVKQSVPLRLLLGETVQASITMRNVGLSTWVSGEGVKLGSQATENNILWTGASRVSMGVSPIAPGQDHTFIFNITAPSVAGDYAFQWLMIKEGVEWFGEPSSLVRIRVDDYASGNEDDGLPASFTTDSTGTGVPDVVKAALGLSITTPASSVPGSSQGYQYDELQRLTEGPGRTYSQDAESNIVSQ